MNKIHYCTACQKETSVKIVEGKRGNNGVIGPGCRSWEITPDMYYCGVCGTNFIPTKKYPLKNRERKKKEKKEEEKK